MSYGWVGAVCPANDADTIQAAFGGYHMENQAVWDFQIPDEDAEIGSVPTDGGGHKPEAEMDRLSKIEWQDQDKIEKIIT